MDVKEQYACTKVMPLSVEVSSYSEDEGNEENPDARTGFFLKADGDIS